MADGRAVAVGLGEECWGSDWGGDRDPEHCSSCWGCLVVLLLLLDKRAADQLLPSKSWPVVLMSSRQLWRSKFGLPEPQKIFFHAGSKETENFIVYNSVQKGWTHLAD